MTRFRLRSSGGLGFGPGFGFPLRRRCFSIETVYRSSLSIATFKRSLPYDRRSRSSLARTSATRRSACGVLGTRCLSIQPSTSRHRTRSQPPTWKTAISPRFAALRSCRTPTPALRAADGSVNSSGSCVSTSVKVIAVNCGAASLQVRGCHLQWQPGGFFNATQRGYGRPLTTSSRSDAC